jgi:hypothetical protein
MMVAMGGKGSVEDEVARQEHGPRGWLPHVAMVVRGRVAKGYRLRRAAVAREAYIANAKPLLETARAVFGPAVRRRESRTYAAVVGAVDRESRYRARVGLRNTGYGVRIAGWTVGFAGVLAAGISLAVRISPLARAGFFAQTMLGVAALCLLPCFALVRRRFPEASMAGPLAACTAGVVVLVLATRAAHSDGSQTAWLAVLTGAVWILAPGAAMTVTLPYADLYDTVRMTYGEPDRLLLVQVLRLIADTRTREHAWRTATGGERAAMLRDQRFRRTAARRLTFMGYVCRVVWVRWQGPVDAVDRANLRQRGERMGATFETLKVGFADDGPNSLDRLASELTRHAHAVAAGKWRRLEASPDAIPELIHTARRQSRWRTAAAGLIALLGAGSLGTIVQLGNHLPTGVAAGASGLLTLITVPAASRALSAWPRLAKALSPSTIAEVLDSDQRT